MEDGRIICGPELKDPIPECSLGELLIPRMKSQPKDNIIQIDFETGTSKTTHELLKESLGLAEGLLSIGLHENDVIGLVSKNRCELYVATLGIIWAGGVAAPMYHAMTVHELKQMFEKINPKYVFSEEEAVENVEKALDLLKSTAKIILFDDKKRLPYIKFEKLLMEVDVETYNSRPITSPATQLAVIQFSSGTTGSPKAIGLTHQNLISQLAYWEFGGKPLSQMTLLQWAHLFCISGILSLLLSVSSGMKRIFVKNITADNILKAIHECKPTWIFCAPSIITFLTNHPDFKKFDVSSIELISIGGSVVSEGCIERIKKEWNKDIKIEQVYGITELSGLIMIPDPAINILSLGKVGPGMKCKIINVDTKKFLGPNEVGEICLKSKGMMKCYIGNPEETNEVIDNDGWFHTSDLGYYDDNEYFYFVDRTKEIIKCQCVNVSPAELESFIETLPGVLEVGVVGIPNENDMYHPMALVVKKNGSNITEDDIIRLVEENLSDYKRLTGGVKFVESIPRTLTGKIKRQQLKELAKSLNEVS